MSYLAMTEKSSVAASNSARSTVVSGDLKALAALEHELTGRGVYFKRVQVDVASHCSEVDRFACRA